MLHGPHADIYIAGSMHMLSASDATLPRGFETAYAHARHLVFEIDMDPTRIAEAGAFTQAHATYPAGQGLKAALAPEVWRDAEAECRRLGLAIEDLDGMEPWALALLLSMTAMQQDGLVPALGVEEQLEQRALADGKDVAGLETVQFQLSLFDSLDAPDQARLLELTVSENRAAAQELATLTRAWRTGDTRELERLLLHEYRLFPSLYESLVYQRNRNWLPRIEALRESDSDVLVVVGALHLVGERGLIALLEARGLWPRRVQ